nr:39s ribosomal protein l41-a, mitochondrial [Quercus suber]
MDIATNSASAKQLLTTSNPLLSLANQSSELSLCASASDRSSSSPFWPGENKMPLGLILGLGRAFRRKRPSSLDILSSKRAPRDYYKGKNCKPTGFHTRKGGYVVVNEKLPNYVVPDLTDFKLRPYVSQCPREVKTAEATDAAK